MRCFACDATVELTAGERVGFRDTCPACHGDLHVCMNCTLHDPGAHNQCRESNAEWVSDRERANHCEYFTPGERGGGAAAEAAGRARSQIEDLFKKR